MPPSRNVPANDLLGGLHGEFAAMAKDDGLLMDLSDLVAELDISPALLEAGMLGSDEQLYIPWMQATYIMAAHKSALEYLPEGADLNALTWDQVKEWGANLLEASGERLLGFPTGDQALHHRLFQGYLYPSFTGGVNTTFATPEAVEMWNWLADLWQYVNPESVHPLQVPAGPPHRGFRDRGLGPHGPPDRGPPLQPGRLRRVPGAGRPGGSRLHARHRRTGHPQDGPQPGRRHGPHQVPGDAGHPGHHTAGGRLLPGRSR